MQRANAILPMDRKFSTGITNASTLFLYMYMFVPVQINGNHDDNDEQEVEKSPIQTHTQSKREVGRWGLWREFDEPLRITKQNIQICMCCTSIYMIYLRLLLVYIVCSFAQIKCGQRLSIEQQFFCVMGFMCVFFSSFQKRMDEAEQQQQKRQKWLNSFESHSHSKIETQD